MSELPAQDHPFALHDGAYLLGALSAQDRAAYETHLQACDSCSRTVTELAGLPGLLSRVPVEVAEGLDAGAPSPAEPPPASLLAGLLEHVQRDRRRRRRRTVVRAAAGALVAAVLAVVAFLQPGTQPSPAPSPVAAVALVPVVEIPMSVTARLSPVPWGTSVELTCTYDTSAAPSSGYATPPVYSAVVRDASGRTEQVASWRAIPGRVLTVRGATALRPGQITEIEVRTADGTPVLRGTSL